MKKTIWILICLCSMLAAVNGYAGTGDWQKIENALYSIEVPAGWAPQDGSPKMEPGRREARGFELRYLSWRSPIHSAEDLPDVVGMYIQSYRKLDGSPITISELEKLTVFNYVSREVLASSEGSLLLSVQRDSREMDQCGSFGYGRRVVGKSLFLHVVGYGTQPSLYARLEYGRDLLFGFE